MLDVAFTRQALDDILAARDWYRAVSERLEERFRADVAAAVRRVALSPRGMNLAQQIDAALARPAP